MLKRLYYYLFFATIITVASSYESHGQAIDTLTLLKEKITDNKKEFIGQPFSKLLEKLPFPILSYINKGSFKNKYITPSTHFFFYSTNEWDKSSLKKIRMNVIWKIPLNSAETKKLQKTITKFAWTQTAIDFYADKIVSDVNIYVR